MLGPTGTAIEMSKFEKRRIDIGEQLRQIEEQLFLLTAKFGKLAFHDGHSIMRLRLERTHLANELLLIEYR